MDAQPVRSTVSILRTVLHLLEDDPALRMDSETVQEFRHAALKLIAEIESQHGFSVKTSWSSVDHAGQDTVFKT